MNKFLLAVGVIAVMLGVKMIYDARPLVKMYFSFGEENEAVLRHENTGIYHFNHWWHFIIF